MRRKIKKLLCASVASVIAVSASGVFSISTSAAEGDVAIDEKNFPDDALRNIISEALYPDPENPEGLEPDNPDFKWLKADANSDGKFSDKELKNLYDITIEGEDVKDLTGLNLLKYLNGVHIRNTSVTKVKSSQLPSGLECLEITGKIINEETGEHNSKLTSLDVSKNTKLIDLQCYNNKLKSLNVSKNTKLEWLNCSNNQIKSLNVSKNTALIGLWCGGNQIKSLNVSKNKKLEQLDCGGNQLTSLDVSKNTALTGLWCGGNQLKSLNVSKNTALTNLDCAYNQLVSLNISKNTELNFGNDEWGNPCFNCEGNVYPIGRHAESYDVSALPNFDPKKASDWNGAEFDPETNTISNFTVSDELPEITYKYDIGQGKSETFRLALTTPPSEPVAINEKNFPDKALRKIISEAAYPDPENPEGLEPDNPDFKWLKVDADNDGIFSDEELQNLYDITIDDKNVKDLTGLNLLQYLNGVHIFNTSVTEVKASQLPSDLEYLEITGEIYDEATGETTNNSKLTSLDVSQNTNLRELNCYGNQLKSLDVSKNKKLEWLNCGNNKLTALDVSKNTALTGLCCYNNQLKSLDVTNNTKLNHLDHGDNQLTTIDVSKNTYLRELHCYGNQLKSLDVIKNTKLTYLDCGNNQIPKLDVSKNTKLDELYCNKNQLKSLDVTKNTNLIYLVCSSNQLKNLDVTKNTKLDTLNFRNNKLRSLDVSKNTKLTAMNCGENQLKSLNVSKNTNINWLYCANNKLTKLNVNKNKELEFLDCGGNQLTSLNVSKNTKLNFGSDEWGNPSFNCEGNAYPIGKDTKSYDLSKLPNFDPKKASKWEGAEFDAETNTISNFSSDTITYKYDIGQGKSETFTLSLTD